MPNSAVERAEVVANIIKLHLNWEAENLKNGVNASASLNSFVEFAALFLPQAQDLALGAYIGGEDTVDVRFSIATVALNLLCWMVELCVLLAEYHAPMYQSYHAIGWYDEGLKALMAIDTSLEAVCKHHIASFPEANILGSNTQMPGLCSPRIMEWTNKRRVWANKMAARLHSKAPMVPDLFGNVEEPLGLLRQALDKHMCHYEEWMARLM